MARSATTDRYQEIVEAARKRWKSRRRVISTARKNADQQAWTKLDTPERLIQRAERLGNWLAAAQKLEKQSPEDALALALVAEDQGKLDALKHDSAARESAREEARKLRDKPEQIDDRTFERILGGSRDLLSVEFFEQGLLAARSVGMVSTDQQENGTGFLVGPGMMLTNWHVLEDAAMAERSDMMLDFETNRVGPHKDSQIFPFDPETFFLANKKLDYALVAVQPTSLQGGQLESFGFLPLIGTTGKAVAGECVNVVQHPRGKAKQICIRNNRILDLPGSAPKPDEELDPYLLYEADTERGSSGSPVCNDQWEVVVTQPPEPGPRIRGICSTLVRKEDRCARAGSRRSRSYDRVWWMSAGGGVSSVMFEVTGEDTPWRRIPSFGCRAQARASWMIRCSRCYDREHARCCSR